MTTPSVIEALADPQRRGMYETLLRSGPMTRKDLGERFGMGVSLVSFHLDKLVDAGLVAPGGQVSTGLRGRPAVTYVAALPEAVVSLPPRRYELAGELLLEAARSANPRTGFMAALRAAARRRGAMAGRRSSAGRRGPLRRIADLFMEEGYEPAQSAREIVFSNCPFDRLRHADTEMVCAMNVAFAEGCLHGLGVDDQFEARFQPSPPACCVVVAPRGRGS